MRRDSRLRAVDSRTLVVSENPCRFDPAAGHHAPCGWVRVDARLGPQAPYSFATLVVRRGADRDRPFEIPLFVTLAGTLHELIRLPDDVVELSWRPPAGAQGNGARLTLRRVGRFERMLRMGYRVLRVRAALPEELRASADLTLRRALRDLPGAYRTATDFRVRDPARRYADWIEAFDTLRPRDVRAIRADILRLRHRPRFWVLVLAAGAVEEAVAATLESVRNQLYAGCECIVVQADSIRADWVRAFNASLASAGREEWLMLIRAGDRLRPHSLYWFAREIEERPEAVVLYSDDDRIDAGGRRSDPRFKPDWSPVHFESADYIGAAAVVRADAAHRAGGLTRECCRFGSYDLLLRVTDAYGDRVAHVPAILLHRWVAEEPVGLADWRIRALEARFRRRGLAVRVEPAAGGAHRPRYALPEPAPRVSIIVPTRDALALLRPCIESVLARTTYPDYELIVVDNGSRDAATLDYLAALARRPRVRVLRFGRRFNYSAINNFAVRQAEGDMLCLLNDDTEVISPDWLEEMAGHLLRPAVGVVGAKLYYPDGRVQHAGVTVGPGGCANHLHAGLGRDEPGYCGRALLAQEYSAVTAACLLTWTRLFRVLGGLNTRRLPVTFNDVDYCLRVQEAGYRVVFTPYAELIHHESATRGRDVTVRAMLRVAREIRYMRTRWRERMRHDPCYNPNLSYMRPDFSLGETCRVRKPWLREPR